MAVACKRAKNLDGVIVSICTCYLIKGLTATRYLLPEAVQREVIAFDRGGGFAPGEYSMLAPRKSHRLGEHRGGEDRRKRTAKMAKPRHFTEGIRTVLG